MGRIHLLIALAASITFSLGAASAKEHGALSVVVMDPLAAPLSCPCVEGYAQRDYKVLVEHLQSSLGRSVQLTFAESLSAALKKTNGKVDVVIGKQSVVQADLAAAKIDAKPLCRLTDREGSTDQYGMIVVNKDDPAKSITDLRGYTIIFGPAEAAEKSSAAIRLLDRAKVLIPKEKRKVDEACSDGACKVIDLGPTSKTAAVISSYAQPLLEGCGTIKKGDLRVVAKTAAVPFVTLFAAKSMEAQELKSLRSALETVAEKPKVLDALESLLGFLPIKEQVPLAKKN